MTRIFTTAGLFTLATCLGSTMAVQAKPVTTLKLVKSDVPTRDKTLPNGRGVDAINANGLMCHCEDHVMSQPSVSQNEWGEIVEKILHAYKAPVSEEDQAVIADYLASINGKP